MKVDNYLMYNEEEIVRLEQNVNVEELKKQAKWCGLRPGMRILEVGCGPGKTTSILWEMIQPYGQIVGVSYLDEMIEYAQKTYGNREGIHFHKQDFLSSFTHLGLFDIIWLRFVLEYHKNEGFDILKNLTKVLKSGGYLCLLDLDYNCLSYYPIPQKMEDIIVKAVHRLKEEYNFDPFAGRKLYTYLYDLGFRDIEVDIRAYHLIFCKIGENELFNWIKKAEVLSDKLGDIFSQYPGGKKRFLEDFRKLLLDERRFIYTPLILCKGIKP